MNFNKEIKTGEIAIKKASKLLMKYFNQEKQLTINAKGYKDIVTEADISAEDIIIKTIKKKFPEHQIISEEAGSSGNSDYKWLIDPIDGTHNFAFGVPIWGTMLALKHKENVVLSVINLPLLNEFYIAKEGKGAYLNSKQIHVSARTGRVMIIFSGMLGYDKPYVKKKFDKVAGRFHVDLRILGCIALSGALVAIGRSDGIVVVWENVSPWDIAPAALLIEEAGGKVTDTKGRKWNSYQKEYILSNGKIHNEILNALK